MLAWRPRLPTLAARIGDWSYAAYLGHALALDILARILVPYLAGTVFASPVFYTAALLASLVLAWLSHRLIELPLLKLGKSAIRALLPDRSAPGPA